MPPPLGSVRRIVLASALATALACAEPADPLVVLDRQYESFVADFNAAVGVPRFVVVIAPT